jgi:hypothetical protein
LTEINSQELNLSPIKHKFVPGRELNYFNPHILNRTSENKRVISQYFDQNNELRKKLSQGVKHKKSLISKKKALL